MTHKDDVISFLRKHPGSSQKEIFDSLHNIRQTQEVHNILAGLMKNDSLRREAQ